MDTAEAKKQVGTKRHQSQQLVNTAVMEASIMLRVENVSPLSLATLPPATPPIRFKFTALVSLAHPGKLVTSQTFTSHLSPDNHWRLHLCLRWAQSGDNEFPRIFLVHRGPLVCHNNSHTPS
jgi:hypothetical protein